MTRWCRHFRGSAVDEDSKAYGNAEDASDFAAQGRTSSALVDPVRDHRDTDGSGAKDHRAGATTCREATQAARTRRVRDSSGRWRLDYRQARRTDGITRGIFTSRMKKRAEALTP